MYLNAVLKYLSQNIIHFLFSSSRAPLLVHGLLEQASLLQFKMNKCVICFHDAVGNLHHKNLHSTNLTLKMFFVSTFEDQSHCLSL